MERSMMMGRVWRFGDNVNTDEIIPGRYNLTTDRAYLAEHVLCEVRPDFPVQVRPGDVIVGGNNFGCGSSREHAPVAIQAAGTACVVARSFARIFYRNAINIGLPILVSPEASDAAEDGERIEVDPVTGRIALPDRGLIFHAEPLPPFVLRVAEVGGMLEFVKQYGWEGVTRTSFA
jgi:3-isopropylmalate/(R)-2-methylmalate dehydratase small subunit